MNNQIYLCGSPLKNITDFFTQPFNSSYINVFEADEEFLNEEKYALDEIKCKMVGSKYRHKLVFIPLVHTLDIFSRK